MATKVYFDGGCKPNPGKMEVAVILDRDGVLSSFHERIHHGTNNEAEWIALLWALDICHTEGEDEILVFGDSQLIVNQANGTWKCKNQDLKKYLQMFQEKRGNFRSFELRYIDRANNAAGSYIEAVN